ncbi:MAG: hypothetical protein NTW87_28205 [Planctomycetota bacterium]|nr:hypothetical protein [Planctomycetota bacterium]
MQPLFEFGNWLCQPVVFYTGLLAAFAGALACRGFLVKTKAAASLLDIGLLMFGVSTLNPQFAREATRPDNAALWTMLFLTGLCLWVAFRQAVDNDARLRQGLKPEEAEAATARLHVWPHLLYLELVVAAFVTALLLLWAIGLSAPLEQPADPANSPNPAKAPWYFVGLQELLVYFDPWIAGVLLPLMAVTGLVCLPYCDRNPEGVGHFSFEKRRFAIAIFLFAFLLLWLAPIVVGTFLRGPNWSFYGPYEPWDVHKLSAANNVNLSQLFWQDLMRFLTGQPRAMEAMHWFKRELPGFIVLALYLTVVPAVVARIYKKLYEQLGFIRYSIVILHLLVMLAVPIKMYLRWAFNLKYVIFVPEFFFGV